MTDQEIYVTLFEHNMVLIQTHSYFKNGNERNIICEGYLLEKVQILE